MVHKIANQADLDSTIEKAGDKLVIIDFYATWCGPCKAIAPVLEKLANEMTDKLVLVKVDVDEDDVQGLVQKYNVSSMPTFVFLKKGEKVEQFAGANEGRLKELITDLTS